MHNGKFDEKRVAAIITSYIISATEKIEKTPEIINKWEEITKVIDSSMIIPGILSAGYYRVFSNPVNIFADYIKKIIHGMDDKIKSNPDFNEEYDENTLKNQLCALLSTAAFNQANGKGDRNLLVSTFYDLKERIIITDNLDVVSAIIACGRISDSGIPVPFEDFMPIIKEIKNHILKIIPDIEINEKDMGIAFVVNSFLESTSKVESYKDISDLFLLLRNTTKDLKDVYDPLISYILLSGRVSDFAATELINGFVTIPVVHQAIVKALKKTEYFK